MKPGQAYAQTKLAPSGLLGKVNIIKKKLCITCVLTNQTEHLNCQHGCQCGCPSLAVNTDALITVGRLLHCHYE